MKNVFKTSRNSLKGLVRFAVFMALLVATGSGFALTGSQPASTVCPAPSNLVGTAKTSNSATIAWTPAAGVGEYVVFYVRHGNGGTPDFTSAKTTVSGSTHTFTGLTPGYHSFYVASSCGDDESGFIVTEDIING
jgi:Fibronectin type III domain